MGKKNKAYAAPRPQPPAVPFGPTSSMATAGGEVLTADQGTEIADLTSGSLDAATEQEVEKKTLESDVPTAPTIKEALREAAEARRLYSAAREKTEKLQSRLTAVETALKERQDKVASIERDLEKREKDLKKLEADLLDSEESLEERERNAEQGFLVQRTKALAVIQEREKALRAEIDSLVSEADRRRSEEERSWRARLEERGGTWRREEEARAERWRVEESAHAEALGRERARLHREIDEERRLAREEMERQKVEEREKNRSEHEALGELSEELRKQQHELARSKRELDIERETLEEDRRALHTKVERLAAKRVAELESDLQAERERLTVVRAERERLWNDLESRRELDRRYPDESPEQVLDRLRQSESRVQELSATLRQSLGQASALRLAELERERSTWLEDRAVLDARLAESNARADRLRIGAVELESLRGQKEALEAANRILEKALEDLRVEVDRFTKADDKRNPLEALLTIDRHPEAQSEVHRAALNKAPSSLATFAKDLRHRIARSLPGRELYYSERDIRCFLGGLAMSRLLLLQGISGTGKTSLPLSFAEAIGTPAEVIEVQAGWRDRQDLIGYYNAFHRHFYATNFLQALYRAGTPAYRDRPFLIVLDEINLSRVEQFFADFLSALEQPEEKRRLTLLNDPVNPAAKLIVDGRHLPIPPNVWFIGTANHDETTTEFADKTYDRAHIMELPRRDPSQSFKIERVADFSGPLSVSSLLDAFRSAQTTQHAAVKQAAAWLASPDGIAPLLERRFRIGWGNRLDRDVELFVPVVVEAGGTLGEAMDHLLATKVLRKLRDRHDVHATGLEEVKKKLESAWSQIGGTPERCLDLIKRELRAKRDEEPDA